MTEPSKCPDCGSPTGGSKMVITKTGVSCRCSGVHGRCGLRFDSMKRQQAVDLGVLREYEAHPGPFRKRKR